MRSCKYSFSYIFYSFSCHLLYFKLSLLGGFWFAFINSVFFFFCCNFVLVNRKVKVEFQTVRECSLHKVCIISP